MAYKVLVPLDGSRVAENSLAYLDALRSMGESEILLISVVDEDAQGTALDPKESIAREENLLATYLREVSAQIHEHIGIDVATKLVVGSPGPSVIDEATRFAPDLLVVSTHGRSGLSRWRLGSVADKIIRGATCNTLVVGPKASERAPWVDARIMEPFKTILAPLDGSTLAESALPVVQSFAQSYGSAVHLVTAVAIPAISGAMGGAVYEPDLLPNLIEGARQYLVGKAATLAGVEVTTKVEMGGAAAMLDDYVTEHAIDLVIMTSHGRGGYVRTALGSVADRLIACAAPVLIVRPRE